MCPGGTRSTSARTTCRRPGHPRCRRSPTRWPPRSRCWTRCATPARCRRGVRQGRRAHLVLRQRRAAVRRGDVQLRASWRCGTRSPGTVRDRGPQGAAVPVRRAGQLARVTEAQPENNVQRIVLEDARRHAVPGRARPLGAVARVERGARAAPPWDQQWRCGCSRCSPSRPTCWSTTTCSRQPGRPRASGRADHRRPHRDPARAEWRLGGAVESGYMRASWCPRWPTAPADRVR